MLIVLFHSNTEAKSRRVYFVEKVIVQIGYSKRERLGVVGLLKLLLL